MSLLCASLLLQVGGAWHELRSLTSGSIGLDQFGYALANAGDLDGDGVNDLIIGSPTYGPTGSGFGHGAVFVHSGATGALLRQHDAPSASYSYGQDVAGGADLDGDGVPDYLVGDPLSNPTVAEVFSGASGALLHQLAPPAACEWFGLAVAIVGDLDLDGVEDLAVSGKYAGPTVDYRLFLYSGSSGALLAARALPDSAFRVVALDDLDGDLIPEIAVAMPYTAPLEAGRVLVLSGATGTVLYRWDGLSSYDHLGWSIAGVPDRDGDGKRDLLIGVPNHNRGSVLLASTGSGATLMRWDRIAGFLTEDFGECVGVAGDMDGDGVEEYLMGGGTMNIAGSQGDNRGGFQIVSGASGEVMLEIEGAYDDCFLGHDCVGLGDLDHDGLAESAVGGAANPIYPGGTVWGSGIVQIMSFERFLNPSATELSASAGSAVTLEFDFPAWTAGGEYRFLASATGDGPVFAGVEIPLTPDALALSTWAGNYPPAMHPAGLAGILDASGHATGSFSFAAGALGSLIGRTLYSAAVAFPPGAQLPQVSSASVRFTIVP